MPIRPGDWLIHARQVVSFKTETAYRDAVGRSYYGTYHRCAPLADDLPSAGERGGVHEQLVSRLIESNNRKLKSIGYMMRQLHQMRVDADYRLDLTVTERHAQEALKQAERLFERASEIDGAAEIRDPAANP